MPLNIYFLLPILAVLQILYGNMEYGKSVAPSELSVQPTFLITGMVTQTSGYCGGTPPSKEVLLELSTPKPSPGAAIFIRPGSINTGADDAIIKVVTDENGEWMVNLPAGKYCLVGADKSPEATRPVSADSYTTMDTECWENWITGCDISFEVTNEPVNVGQLNYNKRCFVGTRCPCVQYSGPIPQATKGIADVPILNEPGVADSEVEEILVSGTVTHTSPYCGGIEPSREILEELSTPKPSPGAVIYIRSGIKNEGPVDEIFKVTADINGEWSIKLQPGQYCLVGEDKGPGWVQPTIQGMYFTYDSGCWENWIAECDIAFDVVDKPIYVGELTFHEQCFVGTRCPCVQYDGPDPPYAPEESQDIRPNEQGVSLPHAEEIMVTGKVTQTTNYCGGAPPPQEMLQQLHTPKPVSGAVVYIHPGDTHAGVQNKIYKAVTDSMGVWRLKLPPGTYCLVSDEKFNQDKLPTADDGKLRLDPYCFEDWRGKCDLTFEVGAEPVQAGTLNLFYPCFTETACPCFQYLGIMPP